MRLAHDALRVHVRGGCDVAAAKKSIAIDNGPRTMLTRPSKKFFVYDPVLREVRVAGRVFALPKSRASRIAVGTLLILGGVFSFLPVLGIWMLPLGFLVLSQDIPVVRHWRRMLAVRYARWQRRRAQAKAERDENTA